MRALILILFSFIVISCSNNNLVFFANNLEEISRTDNSVPTLSSRIYKLRDFGECYEKQCPKEVLYITVSEFGEYPEQKVYVTPKANEWHFIKWEKIPSLGEIDPKLVFLVRSVTNGVENNITVKASLVEIKYINKK